MRTPTRARPTAGWPLCDGVTLAVPVVQAPLGPCDGSRLAAEVSRAGGLGCLSLFDEDAPAVRRRVARVRARTRRPFLLALTNQWEPESVFAACVEGGARLFQVFWWNGPRLAPRVRAAGGRVFWQVGTVEQAREAAEAGADLLVVQGKEAGGQVRGGIPLSDLIPQAIEATGLPVIAGGGLSNAADVARVLALGARAAMLGTRFIASVESAAAPGYKARLLRAEADDLYLDARLIGNWPCAPCRCIRTAAGPEGPSYYAGLGVGSIRRLLPAAEIVRALAPRAQPQQ